MADDVDINAAEGGVDEPEGLEEIAETETEAKIGFLKSKLFKIIAGVIVLLLIAGGAYFFLASEDEEPISEEIVEESIIEEDDAAAIAMPDDSDNLENSSDLKPSDASSEPNTDSVNSNIEKPTSQEQTTNIEVIESQEKAAILQEENLRMQQQIRDLEAKINQQQQITEDQQSIQSSSAIAPIRDPSSVDYQQGLFDESSMREPNRTPPPKPNWGAFDRINKK